MFIISIFLFFIFFTTRLSCYVLCRLTYKKYLLLVLFKWEECFNHSPFNSLSRNQISASIAFLRPLYLNDANIYIEWRYPKNVTKYCPICPLVHYGMSQNIVLFLKIKVINLLMFLLYPINLLIQFFDKFF